MRDKCPAWENIYKIFLLFAFFLFSILALCAVSFRSRAQTTQQLISATSADSWVATDALGRNLTTGAQSGTIRPHKFVGIFYFLWEGAHGYDSHRGKPDGSILAKLPSDTVSPYDNTKLIARNPEHPSFGPVGAWHYWAEPYFGYYLSDDEWVIRKHAQMLADAGVDVIIFDVTNAFIYYNQVAEVAHTFLSMRKEGQNTPCIAFMVNANPRVQVQRLYDQIYAKGLFKPLWFYWKGKPLILTPPEGLDAKTEAFFTARQSWAWKDHWNNWFGNGKDKWPWMDHTPQAYGWDSSPDHPEEISVSVAEHAIYFNEGRSFHDGKEPPLDRYNLTKYTALGLHFSEQWKRALQVDPDFIFITGWNEWVGMRFKCDQDSLPFINGQAMRFADKRLKKGDSYFVDEYNMEFSRDIEPMKGGFGDDYYYQMVNFIRLYKGSRNPPTANRQYRIGMDGNFADWRSVEPVYKDVKGDVFSRNHPGWGRIERYVNRTGRNDMIEARVADEKDQIAFYVKTATGISRLNDSDWMRLYLKIPGSNTPDWDGFHYRINAHPSGRYTTVERCLGGWKWRTIARIPFVQKSNELELEVSKSLLGIRGSHYSLDFKWSDHADLNGDPMHWWDHGDTAPDGRFCYRYHHL